MRMSCNGCRVLRKGCSEDCSIRPCLQWIKSPDSQAHATVFLAKFYGRAGLMNLINAGPEHIRPAIFRSLLYEACGRIVNPIYGSVGLLWSGQWQLCQTAVENVLKGVPITPIATDAAVAPPPNKAYDIRHVTKDESSNNNSNNNSAAELHRVKPTRTRFKRAGVSKPKPAKAFSASAANANANANANAVALSMMPGTPESTGNDAAGSSTSQGSSVSHADEATMDTSMVSVDTAEVEPVADADVEERENGGDGEVELELTLGFGFDPVQRSRSSEPKSWAASRASDDSACNKIAELGLV